MKYILPLFNSDISVNLVFTTSICLFDGVVLNVNNADFADLNFVFAYFFVNESYHYQIRFFVLFYSKTTTVESVFTTYFFVLNNTEIVAHIEHMVSIHVKTKNG